jgi:hypothetical protein
MDAAIIGLINDSLRFGWVGVSHAVIPGHAKHEPGTSRFRVWSF